MSAFTSVVIGNESLLIQCAELLLGRGHAVAAVVTRSPEIASWAEAQGLAVEAPGADLGRRLQDALRGTAVDWLFSIANLSLIPEDVIVQARQGAINFHDGPLPRHAGLNAPVWALLERETHHGVTWHRIGGGVDEGDILEQRTFAIGGDDTALALNARCYAAAIDGFAALLPRLEAGAVAATKQDLSLRSYHARADRPRAAARLDFAQDAEAVVALVRALDHGTYLNPLACPKLAAGGRTWLVRGAAIAEGAATAAPGTVLEVTADALLVATATAPVALSRLADADGRAVAPTAVAARGDVLASPAPAEAAALTAALAAVAPHEGAWRARLRDLAPARLELARAAGGDSDWRSRALALPAGLGAAELALAVGALAARPDGVARVDLAWRDAGIAALAAPAPDVVSGWVPLGVPGEGAVGDATVALAEGLDRVRRQGSFARDLAARDPRIADLATPEVGLSEGGPIAGTCVTVALTAQGAALHWDRARLDDAAAALFAARIEHVAAAVADRAGDVAALPILPAAERALMLAEWNATAAGHDARPVHELIAAQVARTPDAVAVVCEDRSLTYAELDARANRAAQVLRAMGVGPDVPVGLCVPRSVELVVAALAIWKAGGAYLPLDPAYPADRLALYVEDSAAPVIVATAASAGTLPAHAAQTLLLDADPRLDAAPAVAPAPLAGPEHLAYLIYTSGSTGRPKGVMVEHRNVANFFAGMDQKLGTDPGVWLAVTSLSFDISVLELFWTLARGFKLVLAGDENRALVSGGSGGQGPAPAPAGGPADGPASGRAIDFNLFYWGNDDGVGPDKYRLLIEGAKFADAHGFNAVWTPERHFHAFGGPYPNPSVTGAAVAAVTRNLAVRAGSCVAPLHHPARIAEEWAVIDNLTNGRVGLAIASGWQPDDFVLRPENTPPDNKPAMYAAIDQLRRLWRGEAVEFPTRSGAPFAVVTQPRPVSRELPIWVTTAGNPETWKEAGAIGANVLTHLLGQSVAEVADKIGLYHQALRDGGRDPADHKVTLMLHTFVGADREAVRETAREPMKDYLRSAAALIKQYAWAFPAFKKPAGVTNPMQIDMASLEPDEMDAILDFAFRRYFEESGLFGTVEDCLARVEELKRIGVDEVACLIDYGIPVEQVLAGLTPLAQVLARANAASRSGAGPAADDFSIAAEIVRHGVTHLQCTPSMARMIAMNDEARAALSRLRQLMIGGEALPGTLVAELGRVAPGARILNMYGPTETTIWSSVAEATADEAVVNIGRPIANTRLYVLDDALRPVPVGAEGELWIGGEGVTRGYWRREDLTADRFVPDPFAGGGARMYRTGDLARWRPDGRVDFLGRADHQVKLRGHRIELGEIEACLEAQPGVRQAVVLAREDVPGDVRLVAYLTADGAVDVAALRARVAARLPEHMVPAHLVTLPAFPLTPNRKVDRKALPAPAAAAAPVPAAGFVAPAGDVEAQIAGVWARVLGVPRVGAKDNFFELGGHSLLAVQAHREIRQVLGTTRLSITDIFRFPTLGALAAHLAEAPAAAGPGTGAGTAPAAGPAAGPVAGSAAAELETRAEARADAMSRRRAMRAARGLQSA